MIKSCDKAHKQTMCNVYLTNMNFKILLSKQDITFQTRYYFPKKGIIHPCWTCNIMEFLAENIVEDCHNQYGHPVGLFSTFQKNTPRARLWRV